jgi:restriction system protein
MAIPDYQTLMRPLLELLSDGKERSNADLRTGIAVRFRLSESDRRELVPSGQKPLFNDRLSWATSYLTQAGALTRVRRGIYKINARGLALLRDHPTRVDVNVLDQFPEFQAFRARTTDGSTPARAKHASRTTDEEATPEESLESAFHRLRTSIETELLQQVKAAPPEFFERLVVELLVAMGYGGTLRDAGQAIGKAGDGGIDGIIKEDRLGLEVIHVQAKRWDDRTVSRPDVQSFAGSLDGVRAKKGIFITTSTFSSDARSYVDRIDKRIVLIDGQQLATLMYDFGVGVTPSATYAVKRVDSDYFGEE